ncbi:hypothetical protein BU17DRAFT_66949 [Hysterangium stoloniferum]|nr:hypothetical protein BU17DRAFT_66949 [Hysterangium stoloniferum]
MSSKAESRRRSICKDICLGAVLTRKTDSIFVLAVVIPQEPEHSSAATSASDYETSSSSTCDSDSVVEMDATPIETPLSWCCRGETEPYISAEDCKPDPIGSDGLLDSHVYVFSFPDSDLDFVCMGDERCAASKRRGSDSRSIRSSRPRRWSAPYFLQSVAAHFSRKSELPTSSLVRCEETAEDRIWSPGAAPLPKKRPAHLNIQVPVVGMVVKARGGGVAMQCASNKWGNQPPPGYI